MIWFKAYTLEEINAINQNTLASHLDIQFIHIDEKSLKASMPVNERTVQPAGLLHGGASAALAETLGSVGSYLTIDTSRQACVGLELNINHVRSVTVGKVTGIATPEHLGKTTHIWSIRIENDKGQLVAISRLTMMILGKSV
jgi:1,4-dihydroxy-2-naphthoyl-CoA hydrolase